MRIHLHPDVHPLAHHRPSITVSIGPEIAGPQTLHRTWTPVQPSWQTGSRRQRSPCIAPGSRASPEEETRMVNPRAGRIRSREPAGFRFAHMPPFAPIRRCKRQRQGCGDRTACAETAKFCLLCALYEVNLYPIHGACLYPLQALCPADVAVESGSCPCSKVEFQRVDASIQAHVPPGERGGCRTRPRVPLRPVSRAQAASRRGLPRSSYRASRRRRPPPPRTPPHRG